MHETEKDTRIREEPNDAVKNRRREATAALLELAGTWKDERTAEQIVADLRKSRSRR